MRKSLALFVCLLLPLFSFSQSLKEIRAELKIVKSEVQNADSNYIHLETRIDSICQLLVSFDERISTIEKELRAKIVADSIALAKTNDNSTTTTPKSNESAKKELQQDNNRCKAITAKGTQCSRNADPGSDYCWQHQKNSSTTTATSKSSSSSTSRTIYTGPRGGKYYINSKGNKVYIKK